MGKRKDSIALFEVIGKARQQGAEAKTALPPYASPRAVEPPVGPKADGGEAAPAPDAPAEPASAEPQPGRRSIFDAPPAPQGPAVVRDGQRMTVTLSYLNWGLLSAGLVAVVAIAFLIGRSSMQGPGAIPAPADGQAPAPTANKTDGKGKIGGGAAPTSTGRQQGKYYLVIQGGLPGEEEGHRISAFCHENGEPSTVARYSSSDKYFVWSMTPFDSPGSEAALAHAKKIEEMGEKYFAKYKTYKFLQRGRDGKFQPMFLKPPSGS